MKRRKFIALSVAGAITAGSVYSYLTFNKGKKSFAYPESLSRVLDSQTIISIGQDYLAKFPDHNNRDRLLELLKSGTNTSKDVSGLEAAIVKDFEMGNTYVLNGWVVSFTEARQCALLSLNK